MFKALKISSLFLLCFLPSVEILDILQAEPTRLWHNEVDSDKVGEAAGGEEEEGAVDPQPGHDGRGRLGMVRIVPAC